MRKYIFAVCFITSFPALSIAQEAKVLSLAGSVEVKADRDAEWASAEKNMEIKEGGAVRTGADGAAVVLMSNKSKVWMRENSGLEIEQRKTLASRLSLLFGRMKVRVPHLMRKERFEVRTPAAVCAVRGTEFTVDATPEGAMDIKVLYGEVKLNFTVPPVKGRSEIHIPQGRFLSLTGKGKPAKQALLTKEQEYRALENWNPGLDPKERMAEIIEKENSRAQIKQFAKTTTGAEQQVKAFINTAKESDLEAGRTLNDVHGNLVRVEQRLIRPDPQTLQFFNIVKRPEYRDYEYSTSMAQTYGFKYNGPGITNRLDMFQVNMAFDKALPQRIEEWPSFFNNNDINPTYMTTVAANRTDQSSIFFTAEGWKYDPIRDELVNNIRVVDPTAPVNNTTDRDVLITGVIRDDAGSGITAVDGLNRISKLGVVDNGAGLLKYKDTAIPVGGAGGGVVWAIRTADADYSVDSDYIGSNQMWQFQADRYNVGNAGSFYLWFAKENYVIGNGGGIRNTRDFTSSGTDPFTLLKNVAGQTIMYIKNDSGVGGPVAPGGQILHTDYGFGVGNVRNIDLVFIPDLAIAAIQRMLPAITELGN